MLVTDLCKMVNCTSFIEIRKSQVSDKWKGFANKGKVRQATLPASLVIENQNIKAMKLGEIEKLYVVCMCNTGQDWMRKPQYNDTWKQLVEA